MLFDSLSQIGASDALVLTLCSVSACVGTQMAGQQVDDQVAKDQAEALAASVDGVSAAVNELQVDVDEESEPCE